LCQVGQNPTPSPYVANNDPINRKALEGAVELRPPSLERVFKGTVFGSKLKHVVEPRIVYRRVGGVDDFLRIPRLDWRDVLSDTHEVEYDIVNRLFAKKEDPGSCATTGSPAVMPPVGITEQGQVSADAQLPQNITAPAKSSSNEGKEVLEGKKDVTTPCAPPGAHELISWELAQKYFLDSRFGGALIPGQPNVFATTVDFDALAFLTTPRRLSPWISRLRFQPSSIDVAWDADYDFTGRRINYSSLTLGYHLGQFGLAGGDTYLVVPGVVTITKPDVFNQARAQITYGSPVKRGLSGTSLMGFDIHSGFLQYLAVQSSYNWDCCGFTVDFRRFVLGPLRNENQYRFTFNVANIGSFGNLTRRYRMY
jgi:LPS-assembly protein